MFVCIVLNLAEFSRLNFQDLLIISYFFFRGISTAVMTIHQSVLCTIYTLQEKTLNFKGFCVAVTFGAKRGKVTSLLNERKPKKQKNIIIICTLDI